jgi:hypothetical protein
MLKNELNLDKIIRLPCFGHVLNICINDGIKDFAQTLINLRNFGSSLKNSSKKQQTFEETSKALKLEYLKLRRDTHIRWNSTYEMVEKGLKMKRAIQIMTESDVDLQECNVSDFDWKKLEIIYKYLKPFYETTKDLSTQKHSSICIVLPVYEELSDYLLSTKNSNDFKISSEKMHIKLKKYENLLKNDLSYFAIILDPRLNVKYLKEILEETELENIKKKFIRKFETEYSKPKTIETTENENHDNSLWRKIYKKRKIDENEEMTEYFKLAQEPENTEIINWWRNHESTYPSLANFAFDVLCIPATSVPSEQIFSKAGDLVTKKRNKLSEKTIKALMCLKSFNAYFDTD